jgi:hypothetical protein
MNIENHTKYRFQEIGMNKRRGKRRIQRTMTKMKIMKTFGKAHTK